MPPERTAAALAAALLLLAGAAAARTWTVEPGGEGLARVLREAADGDRVVVVGGVHRGPFEITRSLELVGRNAPLLDGGGRQTVVAVRAPGVRIEGFEIRGSGASLDEENSGLAFDGAPHGAAVGNRFRDVLFGIYLRESPGTEISGNEIHGKRLPLARRGDAIRVWYSDDVVIAGNRIRDARDLVLWYSQRLTVVGNEVTGGRYGLHFMYCDDASIRGNRLEDNSVGAFLMYSRRLRLTHNTLAGNHGPSGFGVGLKDMDDAELRENLVVGNRVGIFLDNSPRESGSTTTVEGNLVAGNDIGLSLLANVRRGIFAGNSLVENDQQVEIAGGGSPGQNRWHGNHWSDYAGFDADGDGRGDVPHRLDRLFETLVGRRPALRLFAHSPLAEAVDYAARAFPLFRPRPLLVDEAPRMRAQPPEGCPEPERRRGPEALWAAAGLLLGAGLLAWAPRAAERIAGGGETGGAAAGTEASGPRPVTAADGRLQPLVRVRGVTKRFRGRAALDAVSFDVAPGSAVALWGPNGAGKTTALRAILGVIPVQGEVRVAGRDPWRDGRGARRQIGFVPQEIELQGDLSVDETMRFFARLRRSDPQGIEGIVARLGLGRDRPKRVGELSGGLRQRLALGLALLSDPPLLLLDEPTSNLDARSRAGFLELLLEIKAEGRTLLFSSHRPEEVAALADRVLHLQGGRLAAETGAGDLLGNGNGEVDLWLRLPEAQRSHAEQVLAEAGFPCRRLGASLVVRVPTARKAAPMTALAGAGLEIEDFQLQPGEDRGGGGEA